MFTVSWFRYPHGIEGEEMTCNSREFTDKQKAINFLHGRMKVIKGINWAGGFIEDENGKMIYDITSDGEIVEED